MENTHDTTYEYFHVTTSSNWKKIKKEGLIPKIGKRSLNMNEQEKSVFLFTSEQAMEDGVCNWLGDEFPAHAKLVCLKVALSENPNKLNKNELFFEKEIRYVIEPSKITLYKFL